MKPPYGRKWRRTKEPLDESKRWEWKSWLKIRHSKNWDHVIQSYHFVANRWGNNGSSETLFSCTPKSLQKVTVAMKLKDTCSLEEKLWSTSTACLKSRDITLPTKVHLVKAVVFPVVMYGCESWTIKKTECWRTDAFKMWFWRRLFRVTCTARSNQSILKEVSPEYALEGLIWSWNSNTLATWCEELTHGKDPDAGKDWRQEEKGTTEDEMVRWHHWLNRHEFE